MVAIQQRLTPYNFASVTNRNILYIVIHYVGAESSAENNATYFANNRLTKSAHYFVDETSIWQSVEDKNVAWHCGGGLHGDEGHTFYKKCTNSNSIGIEMCCKKSSSGWYFEDNTVRNTVDLVKCLMEQYNIPIERVIRHYDVTGKICPAPYVDEQEWTVFKNMIIREEEEMIEKVYHNINEVPEWAKPTMQKIISKGWYKGTSATDLDLSDTLMRTMVILDRVGIFDK